MRRHPLFWLALVVVLCASCGEAAPANDPPFCPRPEGTPHYLTVPPDQLPAPQPSSSPAQVEIGGRSLLVDRVVEGPLCNDAWSGTVYVTCNVQVYPWEEQPTFLQDCDLTVEPGTVVYVADHGNEPYYKGCSCHTGSGGQ
ncbi:MAG TPA: hypothetical protein PKO09_12835 [Anaerolineae bacterium]|nr:hypothetical protein [Anaerolineae bacterium]